MQINGPYIPFLLGRRDGRVSLSSEAADTIIPQTANASVLKAGFRAKGLDTTDLVALSGEHTLVTSHESHAPIVLTQYCTVRWCTTVAWQSIVC